MASVSTVEKKGGEGREKNAEIKINSELLRDICCRCLLQRDGAGGPQTTSHTAACVRVAVPAPSSSASQRLAQHEQGRRSSAERPQPHPTRQPTAGTRDEDATRIKSHSHHNRQHSASAATHQRSKKHNKQAQTNKQGGGARRPKQGDTTHNKRVALTCSCAHITQTIAATQHHKTRSR